MRNLFMMECKKTARGILYWLYVLALFIVSIRRFRSEEHTSELQSQR